MMSSTVQQVDISTSSNPPPTTGEGLGETLSNTEEEKKDIVHRVGSTVTKKLATAADAAAPLSPVEGDGVGAVAVESPVIGAATSAAPTVDPSRTNSMVQPIRRNSSTYGSTTSLRGLDAASVLSRKNTTLSNRRATALDHDSKRREDILQLVRGKTRRPRIDQVLSSHTFAQEHSNALAVPALYRRPLVTLERLDTVCVSMECLYRLCGLAMPKPVAHNSTSNRTSLLDPTVNSSSSPLDPTQIVIDDSSFSSPDRSMFSRLGTAASNTSPIARPNTVASGWSSTDEDGDDSGGGISGSKPNNNRHHVGAAGKLNAQQRSTAAAQLGISGLLFTKLRSKLRYLGRIYDQLGEDPNEFHANVRFTPGRVVEEIDSIVSIKASELATAKDSLLTDCPANLRLCERFLRGNCNRGITCQDSHTDESLMSYMRTWLTEMYVSGLDGNSNLEFGNPESWMAVGGIPPPTSALPPLGFSSVNKGGGGGTAANNNNAPSSIFTKSTLGGGGGAKKGGNGFVSSSPATPQSSNLKERRISGEAAAAARGAVLGQVSPTLSLEHVSPSQQQNSNYGRPFGGDGDEGSSDEEDLDEEATNRRERYRLRMVLSVTENFGPEATTALLHELHLHQAVQWKAHKEYRESTTVRRSTTTGGSSSLLAAAGPTTGLSSSTAPLMRKSTTARLHRQPLPSGNNKEDDFGDESGDIPKEKEDSVGGGGGGGLPALPPLLNVITPISTFTHYPPFTSIVFRNFNTTSTKCIKALTELIKTNALPFVHHIDLAQNALGSTVPRGILRLAKAVLYNETLHSLGLAYNHLGNAGALAILQSLDQNDTLRALDLGANGLNPQDSSFEHVCKLLLRNPLSGIRKISLAGNAKLSSLGVKCIVNVLSQNEFMFLTHLDLYRCDVGDNGCRALAYFLRSTSGCGPLLRLLDLGWNGITADGMTLITQALQSSTVTPPGNNNSNNSPATSPAAASSPGGGSPGGGMGSPLNYGLDSPGSGGGGGGDPFSSGSPMSQGGLPGGGGGGAQRGGVPVEQAGHTCLQVLKLNGNPSIGRKGALVLASFLKHTAPYMPLTRLDLRWTSPTDDGVATIADAVQYCPLLLEINVGGNDLDARTEALLTERLGALAQNRGASSVSTSLPFNTNSLANTLKGGLNSTAQLGSTNSPATSSVSIMNNTTTARKATTAPLSIEQILHPAEIVTPRDMII